MVLLTASCAKQPAPPKADECNPGFFAPGAIEPEAYARPWQRLPDDNGTVHVYVESYSKGKVVSSHDVVFSQKALRAPQRRSPKAAPLRPAGCIAKTITFVNDIA